MKVTRVIYCCDVCGKEAVNREHSVLVSLSASEHFERDFCSKECADRFCGNQKIPSERIQPWLDQFRTKADDFLDGWIEHSKAKKADADKADDDLTISIPEAGRRYYNLCRNASYAAAKRGDIPTVRVGRLKRVPIQAMEMKFNALTEQAEHGARPLGHD